MRRNDEERIGRGVRHRGFFDQCLRITGRRESATVAVAGADFRGTDDFGFMGLEVKHHNKSLHQRLARTDFWWVTPAILALAAVVFTVMGPYTSDYRM